MPTVAPCVYGPQGFTNATYTDASGKPHFLSGFTYADFILNNQFKTGWNRFPINLMLEYEDNLDAAAHPLDSKGNVLTDLGSQGKAYQVDFSVGQLKNRNDIQLGYAWWRQEQDAAISSFLESETARSFQHPSKPYLCLVEDTVQYRGQLQPSGSGAP